MGKKSRSNEKTPAEAPDGRRTVLVGRVLDFQLEFPRRSTSPPEDARPGNGRVRGFLSRDGFFYQLVPSPENPRIFDRLNDPEGEAIVSGILIRQTYALFLMVEGAELLS